VGKTEREKGREAMEGRKEGKKGERDELFMIDFPAECL
jgi:hypothetical protein